MLLNRNLLFFFVSKQQFSITCLPYIQYCLDQSSAQDYCRRMDQINPLFKGYLAVCIFVLTLNSLNMFTIFYTRHQLFIRLFQELFDVVCNTPPSDFFFPQYANNVLRWIFISFNYIFWLSFYSGVKQERSVIGNDLQTY